MSILKYRLLFVGVLTLFLSSCERKYSQAEFITLHPFSILIEKFDELNKALEFKSGVGGELKKIIHIDQTKDEGYQVLVGKYANSKDAGEVAFNLFTEGIIKKYSIVKNTYEVLDEFNNVLFVSRYDGRPSVFNYNLISKKINVIWSRWRGRVTSLTLSKNCNSLFFTTVVGYGKKRGIPYVHGALLYHLIRDHNEPVEVANLGDGFQLYTYWEIDDTFKVNFTFINPLDSKIVNQRIYSYDSLGNQVYKKEKKYNLLKDGFPAIPNRTPVYNSPNHNFNLRVVFERDESNLYLKDYREHSEILIASTKQKIHDARWSNDGNYLFVLTQNTPILSNRKKAEQTGELWIIDALQKKRLKLFTGYQFENILVHGKFLFFDERLNSMAKICIYNFVQDIVYDTISSPGGCDLNNLPL